jgi:hypothetical protein
MIPLALKIHPHVWPGSQPVSETPRRIGRDAALAPNDLVEARRRNPQMARSIDLRDPLRLQEFFQQHLAGMRRRLLQLVDGWSSQGNSGRGKNDAPKRSRQFDGSEVIGRKEIVFARFINDP